MAIEILRPNGVGAVTDIAGQWPTSGEHWDKVDEVTPDDADTYVRHNQTSYATDTYALPSGGGSGAISKVTVYARCYKISGSYNYAKTVVRTHDTLYEGDEHNLTATWEYISTEYSTNPNTSNPWTWAEIDALEAGVALKSSTSGNYFAICTQVYIEVTYALAYNETGLAQVIVAVNGEGDTAAFAEPARLQVNLAVVYAVQSGENIETGLLQVILTAQGESDNQVMFELIAPQVILAVVLESDYNDYGDWNLLITGKDAAGDFKLWSLVYGDGGDVASGAWSELKEFCSAPSDGDFEYKACSMDKPDVYRCFYVEKFTGTQAYSRPFWSHSVGEGFLNANWREPVPFNLNSEYGLAMAHHGDYCWLARPDGVWRATLIAQSLDLTGDVISVRLETVPKSGRLVVELRNDDGRYASPGQGGLSVLDIGCQLEFSPGYVTSSGSEVSSGQTLVLDAYEHTSSGGEARLILYASDGWTQIKGWMARHQFRWNHDSDEMSVKEILAFVLARAGLELDVKSQSSIITNYYPDFTINPDNPGEIVVSKILSFVPDVLFIEGGKIYIVNPQLSDSSVYSYGSDHSIFDGRYRIGAWELNRVKVEGYDAGEAALIILDSFEWDEIDRVYDRLKRLEDSNINTVARVQERADACLRHSEIESANGAIKVPVNCGQQQYDVVDITDARAGLSAAKKRVLGLTLVYYPRRGDYNQLLLLGAV